MQQQDFGPKEVVVCRHSMAASHAARAAPKHGAAPLQQPVDPMNGAVAAPALYGVPHKGQLQPPEPELVGRAAAAAAATTAAGRRSPPPHSATTQSETHSDTQTLRHGRDDFGGGVPCIFRHQ
jgi:hypothetical protein